MESDRKIAASLPPAPPPAPPPNGASSSFPRVRPMHGRTSGPTRRSTRGQWTAEEDDILCKAVQRYKGKNWKKIAECFKDRTDVQCLHRWQKVLNPELIKGPWSKEEDEIIIQLVNKYGPKKWSTIAQHLPGRIGKQCRERWHNHLNPAINKEAWTQEEELILIRAHQIYGNRWAELTKFLPGRTDNSIKNHWNSSVKKKLDSYIASGLLAQFQGLPVVSHQNQSIPSSSLRVQQSSGDGSVCKDGAEAEENSECSQVGCSQTASDMSNTACHTREDFLLPEESDQRKMQDPSPTASCSEQYYTSLDDITFTIPDIPCEFTCSSTYLPENFTKDPGVPNMPLELADSCSLSGNYFLADPNHDLGHGPSHQPNVYIVTTSANNVDSDIPEQKFKTEERDEGCLLSAKVTNCSDVVDMDRYRDSMNFQCSLQPYNPSNATMVEASHYQRLSSNPSEVAVGNDSLICSTELQQINGSSAANQGQEVAVNVEDAYDNSSSPCHDHMDSSRLIPVNTFGSGTSDTLQTPPVVKRPVEEQTDEQEGGILCYEPPRFPSLEVPFFSCDLAHSGTDAQQDFSPLGIRQLMMSSMNSLTPFKLWDSPSSDDSPDAVLKSAAKTFACTPSILKKRHRELLSPLSPFSERRYDKKTGNDVKQGFLCTSRLTKEFSRLDVIFSQTDQQKESTSPSHNQNDHPESLIEDKENICPASQELKEEAEHDHAQPRDKPSEEEANRIDLQNTEKTVYEDCASETPRGILVERHFNDVQVTSPDGLQKAGFESSDEATEVHQSSDNDAVPEKLASVVIPSSLGKKEQSHGSAISSFQTVSAANSMMVDSLVNEVGIENLNIFVGTPFRRSIESPSAWKSPWYFSSIVPCSRFEAEMMIEDIGIFMSPGERSLDAIGLMKQINEQNADAYADAREVLGSETPESIIRQRRIDKQNRERESNDALDSQHEGSLRLASNVSTERRILDFSECGTPAKAMEKGKCATAASLSSPSSSLLKSYR